ncbi:IS66 family transposase, partial [Granulosicoccus sp.]
MLDLKRPAPPKNLDEARTQIDGLWAIVTELQSVVSELKNQNEELQEQVSELNERIGKSSRNSSRPPSSDSTSQRATRRKKPKSNKAKGAQPGHEKHERALIPESDVDEVQRYFPAASCACGGSVSIEPEPRCRHQVFDIPVVRFSVIEHQLFGGHCSGCGKYHCAQTPGSVPSGQMGPNLVALIAHLSGRYHLSIRNIQNYLYEHWQLSFSLGAISQAQAKATAALGEPYRQIGAYVRSQPVVHADETRHFRGTECRWLWSLVTLQACYFLTQASRGKEAADTLLGEFTGYLVTDDYAGYNRVPESRRQLCWPHLIRKFIDIAGRVGNAGKIGRRLLLLAHSVIRTRHRWQNQTIDETIYYRRMYRLRESFHQTLERGARLRIDGRTKRQCQHLLRREAMCWTFLKDHRIPLDNNTAERALRPYVIWRKLSFSSQSYQGDQFRPLILSIVGTAQRLGLSSYQFLRTACQQSMILG